MGNVNELQEREPDSSQKLEQQGTPVYSDSDAQSSPVPEREESDLPIEFYFTGASKVQPRASFPEPERAEFRSSPQANMRHGHFQDFLGADDMLHANPNDKFDDSVEQAPESSRDDSFPLSDSAIPASFDILAENNPVADDSVEAFDIVREDSFPLSDSAIPMSLASPSEPDMVIDNAAGPALENLRDGSFPHTDSEIRLRFKPSERSPVIGDSAGPVLESSLDNSLPTGPASPMPFDVLSEPSPVVSSNSDIFHTPDVSQLDIEEGLPFINIKASSPELTVDHLDDKVQENTLQVLPTPTELKADITPSMEVVTPTRHEDEELVSRGTGHTVDMFLPCSQTTFLLDFPSLSTEDLVVPQATVDGAASREETSPPRPAVSSLENQSAELTLQVLSIPTELKDDMVCLPEVVAPAEHETMERESPGLDQTVDDFWPFPPTILLHDLDDLSGFAIEDFVMPDMAIDGTLSEEEELNFAPNTSMVVESGIPSHPLGALRKLDETDTNDDYIEPAIPSARDQTTATTLEPPCVASHEALNEWTSVKRVPSPQRHTADEPNWAIAPDDPKRPAVTPTKKPRQGERRRGGRRGKHTRGQNTIPGASNASTYAESNSIDVQPSVVQPFLETNIPLQIGNPIKAATEIITSKDFCPEERRLPDRTPGPKIHTNQPNDNATTQAPMSKAESYNISDLGAFVPKTCPVMESIVPFGDQLLLGPKGKDRRAPRRSAPWRRTTPGLSVPSEPSLHPTIAGKEVPDILYQSSPKVLQGVNEESAGLSIGLNKKMPLKWIATGIEPLMKNPVQIHSSSSMISNTAPEVLGRLTWPSLEEEMRFHATERPLLLATKEVIKPKHSNAPNGFLPPSSKQGPGCLPVTESDGLMAVSKVRCSPFDDTIASGRGNIPAKVNLPSRPSDWEAFSRDPGPRAAFQSGIPVPTRTSLSRSNSLELDPFSQSSINFARFSGQESQNSPLGNGTVSSGRPALQRPLPPKPSSGPHRSTSQTFTLRREIEPTVYTRGTYSHPNAFTAAEIRPFLSHYLPAPSDDVRRAISRASRNEQDTPFPSGDHRAGDYHDQLSSTFPSENIRPSPTSFVGNFQENNPAPNPQISYTRGHIPAHRFAAYQPRDEKNGLN